MSAGELHIDTGLVTRLIAAQFVPDLPITRVIAVRVFGRVETQHVQALFGGALGGFH